jgi:hypothetical protein
MPNRGSLQNWRFPTYAVPKSYKGVAQEGYYLMRCTRSRLVFN